MEGARPMADCLYSLWVKASQLFLSKSQLEPIAQTLGLAMGACFVTKSAAPAMSRSSTFLHPNCPEGRVVSGLGSYHFFSVSEVLLLNSCASLYYRVPRVLMVESDRRTGRSLVF